MGSNYKLAGNVKGALHGWAKRVRKKVDAAKYVRHQEQDQSISLQPIRQQDSQSARILEEPEISTTQNQGERSPDEHASTVQITLNVTS